MLVPAEPPQRDQGAVEGRVRLRGGPDVGDRRAIGRGAQLVAVGGGVVACPLDEAADQGLPVGEVVEQTSLGDLGPCGDGVQRRGTLTLGDQDGLERVEDPVACRHVGSLSRLELYRLDG